MIVYSGVCQRTGHAPTPAEDAASLVPHVSNAVRDLAEALQYRSNEITALAIARVATVGAEHGRRLFTDDVDFMQEAMEELADGVVYLAAEALRYQRAKVSAEDSGLF